MTLTEYVSEWSQGAITNMGYGKFTIISVRKASTHRGMRWIVNLKENAYVGTNEIRRFPLICPDGVYPTDKEKELYFLNQTLYVL